MSRTAARGRDAELATRERLRGQVGAGHVHPAHEKLAAAAAPANWFRAGATCRHTEVPAVRLDRVLLLEADRRRELRDAERLRHLRLSQPRARMFVSVRAVPVKTHSGKYSCAVAAA